MKFTETEIEFKALHQKLLDLKVIIEKKEMIGDGWNNRDTCKFYYLAQ